MLSFTPGFPMADIPDCGMAVFGYGARRGARAKRRSPRSRSAVHDAEPQFRMELFDPTAAVARAMQRGERGAPVVLADTQDNPGAGGNGDTTGLLAALIAADARDAMLGLLIDPASARAGARGRRRRTVGVHASARFPACPGTCRCAGEFTRRSAGRRTLHLHRPDVQAASGWTSGRWRCCSKGGVRVVLASKKCQAADQAMFRHVGIEPAQRAHARAQELGAFPRRLRADRARGAGGRRARSGEGRSGVVRVDAAARRPAACRRWDRRSIGRTLSRIRQLDRDVGWRASRMRCRSRTARQARCPCSPPRLSSADRHRQHVPQVGTVPAIDARLRAREPRRVGARAARGDLGAAAAILQAAGAVEHRRVERCRHARARGDDPPARGVARRAAAALAHSAATCNAACAIRIAIRRNSAATAGRR